MLLLLIPPETAANFLSCAAVAPHRRQLAAFDLNRDGNIDTAELEGLVKQLMTEEANSGRIGYKALSSRIQAKVGLMLLTSTAAAWLRDCDSLTVLIGRARARPSRSPRPPDVV